MLKARIVTALLLILVLLAVVLWLPPAATVVALTAVALAGAWEWSGFLRTPSLALRVAFVALVAVLLPLSWRWSAIESGRDLIMGVAVAWWCVALGWILFAPRRVTPWTAALAGVLALVPAWLALMRLRLDLPRGAEWMLFVLILVWVADIGAFFFGRRFGRRRLAPAVSPGKTWEGVVGGIAVSALFAVGGSGWFEVPLIVFVPLCLVAVAFSIVGDLTESLLKRFAGMKDSGKVFPGHGGVMDRIDSVTAAAPVLFFGLTALGVGT
ncbi:MAG: phosphatidate cytidylyltransferase [Pseudomonadota bacterium]|nr:MAG: phosphatidate cytidylyltransferase [Pseudomonadota bacterium]